MDKFQLREIISRKRIHFLHTRNCSLCGYPLGYIIRYDQVYYDHGCYCVRYNKETKRSWDDLYIFYNLQNDENKNKYINEWGINE